MFGFKSHHTRTIDSIERTCREARECFSSEVNDTTKRLDPALRAIQIMIISIACGEREYSVDGPVPYDASERLHHDGQRRDSVVKMLGVFVDHFPGDDVGALTEFLDASLTGFASAPVEVRERIFAAALTLRALTRLALALGMNDRDFARQAIAEVPHYEMRRAEWDRLLQESLGNNPT